MKKHLFHTLSLLLATAMIALQLAGCASSSSGASKDQSTATATTTEMAVAEEGMVEAPAAGNESAANYDTGGALADTLNQTQMPDGLNLKLIWRANISMETLEYDQSIQQITDLVNQMEGFIESSSSSGGSDAQGNYSQKYASITIRVPSDRLTGFIGSLNDCGTITQQNLSSENISLEYADVEARKEALQTEYDRLIELMAQAENVDAVIAIEARLSEVRLQLDSLSSQLRTYDNLVDYSTVYLDIYEVRNISNTNATTLADRIQNGFSDTLFNLQVFFEDLIVFLIVNIPVFILLAVVIAAIVLILRFVRKRRRAKKATPPAQIPPQAQNEDE